MKGLAPPKVKSSATLLTRCKDHLGASFRANVDVSDAREGVRNHKEWSNNPLDFVRAHIHHGVFDVAASLLGFAVLINAM